MSTTTHTTRARLRSAVGGPFKHSARVIQLLRKQANMTQTDLAKSIDVHQTTVSKWEQGIDMPGGTVLTALASALNVDASEITGVGQDTKAPTGRKVHVVGKIAAGAWAETHELDEQYYTTVPGLPRKFDKVPLQGFVVEGDSMNQIYPDGTVVYVAPIGAVSGWPRSGQVVMVMSHKQGLTEATLKEYVVDENGKWLWPRSNSPMHQTPVDYKNAGAEEVVITGVVVAALVFAD